MIFISREFLAFHSDRMLTVLFTIQEAASMVILMMTLHHISRINITDDDMIDADIWEDARGVLKIFFDT